MRSVVLCRCKAALGGDPDAHLPGCPNGTPDQPTLPATEEVIARLTWFSNGVGFYKLYGTSVPHEGADALRADLRTLLQRFSVPGEEMVENAREASRLLNIATSWGHCPASDGRRIAGFYYKAEDAAAHNVLPAHCLSAMRDLIAAMQPVCGDKEVGDGN